jgi:hypothetical protein
MSEHDREGLFPTMTVGSTDNDPKWIPTMATGANACDLRGSEVPLSFGDPRRALGRGDTKERHGMERGKASEMSSEAPPFRAGST